MSATGKRLLAYQLASIYLPVKHRPDGQRRRLRCRMLRDVLKPTKHGSNPRKSTKNCPFP
jgi:hypothetical protein